MHKMKKKDEPNWLIKFTQTTKNYYFHNIYVYLCIYLAVQDLNIGCHKYNQSHELLLLSSLSYHFLE